MESAFITGIGGFTGRYLAAELRAAGFDVTGTELPGRDSVAFNTYQCDLCDRSATMAVLAEAKPDVIVHLAGIAFVGHGDVDAIYRTNVVGTRNLLEAISACGHKPRTILLASSSTVYGNSSADCLDEATPPAPANDYAVSKLAMEYMAKLWLDRLSINFVRPFNYTGVGQSTQFLLPKIVDHFRRRAPVIELGNLDVIRDFSDVRAVVRHYRQLIEVSQYGEIFNLCSGTGHSLQEVISILRKLSGHNLEVVVNPAFVRTNEVKRLIGSPAKLEATIGRLNAYPIQDTLRWMLAA
ncbi:MAG: GDP-mannose 4,6-dehydratase [Usitatibacteraceae bacterium]